MVNDNEILFNNKKGDKIMKQLKNGDVFFGTHADLLNELGLHTKQGLPFKSWQKGTYELDANTYIWIICIDGEVRNGWRNTYQNNKIIEENLDNKNHTIGLTHKYRVVFDKTSGYYGNKFVCKGLYRLCPKSNNQMRILEKVADVIKL